jgi:hypothetical protein
MLCMVRDGGCLLESFRLRVCGFLLVFDMLSATFLDG